MIGCQGYGRRERRPPVLSHADWRTRLRVVYDAIDPEARLRFRRGLAAETIAPLPARGPRSTWYWPATVAWAQGETLAQIGARHGRSRERVRQVIIKTLRGVAHRDAPDLAAWIDAVEAACPL